MKAIHNGRTGSSPVCHAVFKEQRYDNECNYGKGDVIEPYPFLIVKLIRFRSSSTSNTFTRTFWFRCTTSLGSLM